jgi:tetratricopeptide (TPR) repeat protein
MSPEHLYLTAETGYNLIREGRSAEAIAIFEGLVSLDPVYSWYRLALASAYGLEGRWIDSVRELDALLAMNPAHEEALLRRGSAHIRAGQPAAARADIAALEAIGALDAAESVSELWMRNFPLHDATPSGPTR